MEPLTEQELTEYRLKSALEDLAYCEAVAKLQPFRAGDHVRHAPSGEKWVLACDQQGLDVMPAGWPETLAKATHCRLVKAASDDERLDMLRHVADLRPDHHGDGGRRQRLAAWQLSQPEPNAVAGYPGADGPQFERLQAAVEKAKMLTPEQVFQTSVAAGIHNPDGTLTEHYRPSQYEPEPE